MSAFLIADVSPSDMQAYRDSGYIDTVPKIAAEYGGVYRARGGKTEVLEGEWQPKRLGIIEFPSWDQLQAFYHCQAYAPFRAIRQQLTESHIIALDGIEPPQI